MVSHEVMGNTLLLRLRGDLDIRGAQELRLAAENLLRGGTGRSVILDLTGVEFVDSSGLGAILGRYRQVLDSAGRMAVYGASPRVASLLEVAGITGIIPLHESLDRALAYVKER
ncbi:MAG: anti-sigma factor antagonist [bacterium]|nr:anti-sigma factor antagonist [bacterium]